MKIVVVKETNGLLDYVKSGLDVKDIKSELMLSFDESALVIPVWDNEESVIMSYIEDLSYKYGRTVKTVEIKEI